MLPAHFYSGFGGIFLHRLGLAHWLWGFSDSSFVLCAALRPGAAQAARLAWSESKCDENSHLIHI